MWNMMDRFVFGLIFLILQGLLISATALARDSTLDLTPVEQRWLDDHPTISLAYDGYFPPYSFLNDDGELEGFSIDLMALISQKTGLEFQVHPEHEWKAIYTSAQQHQVDMVTSMVPRDERDQWFEFTKPYIFKSLVVITQDENNSIKQREDIAGKTIALVKDYQYGLQVLNEFPSITPLYVDTMLDALNAVSVGKADATISFLGAGHYYRNKYLLTNLKYTAIYDKRSAFESIAVRKDWPELARILNKALDSISEAQLQQLRTKWLPVDYMENLVEINLTQAEKQWLKDHRDIRLGIDPEFAPFEYLSEGVYQGIASDYIKLLNQRLNLNMTVTNGLTWAEVISNAKQGHIDVLPAVGMTEERKRFLSYTQPYLSFHRVIITRDDAPFIADLSDIQYQTVAVQSNSSHHGYIRENSDIQPVFYKELQQALLAVSGGQADAFVGNVASATYWIRKLNLTNLKIAAPVSTDVQSLHFAVRKDWPELTAILQKGLDTISPRQRKLISEKWLTVEYEPAVDYDLVWKIVIVFSLVLIAILFWSFYLKRKVRLKSSQLAYTKNYDQLTDLPNRFLTLEELQQSIQEAHLKRHKVALISIDIDDFKKINDIFNHQTGDSILRAFSTRLKTSLQEHHSELSLLGKDAPKQQTIGRLGGNQFLVVQGYLEKPADAAVLAEEILACTHKTFAIPEHEISLSVSLGISLYPDDGDNAELLLKHADTATYHAKDQLQVEYAFYTDNLDRNMSRKLELEQNILGALKRNEFDVYFQPKVEAKTRKTTSFEALLRWHSEALGTVSPAEFIPIAEKSGLIEEIGLFVLKESLAALAFWQKRYGISFSMAINLSPVQFRSDDLIPTIESFILHYSLDSKTIEFEITEGVLLSEYPNMEDNLKDLEALGVSLAMDDFGTGYSSLSYLRKYKFDTLKIDREFINDLPTEESDRKLVSATIAMAHELGMTVVAEGVETEAQSDILVEYRCDLLQGWLFNKARPYDEVTTLLDAEYTVQDTAKEII